MKTEFKRFSDMRKEHFSVKAGANSLIIDTDVLNTMDLAGAPIAADLLRSLLAGKINSFVALNNSLSDLGYGDFEMGYYKVYFDFEMLRRSVFNEKTGKRIYIFCSLHALRLTVYDVRDGWRALPCYTSTLGRWSAEALPWLDAVAI